MITFAEIVGRKNVLANTDRGLGGRLIRKSLGRDSAPGSSLYCSNWNRLAGGAPAMYSTIFRVGTETSLQTF